MGYVKLRGCMYTLRLNDVGWIKGEVNLHSTSTHHAMWLPMSSTTNMGKKKTPFASCYLVVSWELPMVRSAGHIISKHGTCWRRLWSGTLTLDIMNILHSPKINQWQWAKKQPFEYVSTPPKFNIGPEKWWLEDKPFLLGRPIFRGYVKFPGCISY